jgi:hypothetical protein
VIRTAVNECLSVEEAVYALKLLHIVYEEVVHADAENFTPTSMYAWHTCSRWYTPDCT